MVLAIPCETAAPIHKLGFGDTGGELKSDNVHRDRLTTERSSI
jgi:hypothetical protein